jgi:hypothetical protein
MANEQSGTGYVFNIKDGQVKRAGNTGTLLSILAVIIFLTRFFRDLSFLNLVVAILITLALFWNLFFAKKLKRLPDYILLFCIGIALILIPLFNLIGIFYLLLSFISFRLSNPAQVKLTDDGIILQSLWRNAYPWEQVRFVVLKDNLLTVELNNNKLIQFEIEDVEEPEVEEFKNFTARKIESKS